eukprot:15469202-Alexandrium_andersonii.AAC.1
MTSDLRSTSVCPVSQCHAPVLALGHRDDQGVLVQEQLVMQQVLTGLWRRRSAGLGVEGVGAGVGCAVHGDMALNLNSSPKG